MLGLSDWLQHSKLQKQVKNNAAAPLQRPLSTSAMPRIQCCCQVACLFAYTHVCVAACACMFCLTASVLWTQSEFSACELASIATSATQSASQPGGAVNERHSARAIRKWVQAWCQIWVKRARRYADVQRQWAIALVMGRAGRVTMSTGMWMTNNVNSNFQSLCLFSYCFPFHPPLFFVCCSASTYLSSPDLSLFAFLLSSFSSVCVSMRKRLRHCGGGCWAGAWESFFFLSVCYCQSRPITLDTHTQTYMRPQIQTREHTHTHLRRQTHVRC